MVIKAKIDNKEIFKTLKEIDENFKKELLKEVTHTAFEKTLKYAKAHRDTGRMEANIRMKIYKNKGEIFIDDDGMLVNWKGKKVNYAAFVLYGSKPHLIKPKQKKALRFTKVEDFVFAKRVNHSGYKGDNFLYRAVEDTFKKIDEIAKRIKL